ncbi:hypothetical protein [Aquimarina pacifica]|uniref:hypothetical protein n=1 Tax=Aquimarina pacifica TaxID=1296415 RepID=UPI00046E9D5C|nr:hypothetical protein [Aquimarina pacifica]
MDKQYKVRKSIYKPYRYDNTNTNHLDVVDQLFMYGVLLLILVAILNVTYSGSWWYYIGVFSVFVTGVPILLFILNSWVFYRYYRLIKRTTKQAGAKEYETYVVQSYVSCYGLKKMSNNRVKWRDIKSGEKEDMEVFFDQKTIEAKEDKVIVSEIRKSIHKPRLLHTLIEKTNLVRREIVLISLLIGIPLFFVVTFSLKWLIVNYNLVSIESQLVGLSIFISLIIVVYIFYPKSRYLRLIQRTIHQGRYQNRSYRIESYVSRKRNKKKVRHENLNWKHFKRDQCNREVGNSAKWYFSQETVKEKVSEEVI